MQPSGLQDGRFLIVDGQPANILLLERILTLQGTPRSGAWLTRGMRFGHFSTGSLTR